jgi:ABC-type polysaccharide/polyol phosphate export permease
MSETQDIWKERRHKVSIWFDLVYMLVQRELRVRYRGSFFGYLWSMMNPLLYMTILSFVFAHFMRFQIEHYAVFLLSGILVWNLFQQSMVTGVHSIVNNGGLMRKVKVPNSIFPAASVCSMLVNFVLAMGPFVVVSIVTGHQLTAWILLLPIMLIPYIAFIFGFVLIVASLNVYFRDIGHVMEPVLMIAFYATPVIYPEDKLPEPYHALLNLNPLAHFLREFRRVLFYGQAPTLAVQGMAIGFGAAALGIGLLVYRSRRDRFIYAL